MKKEMVNNRHFCSQPNKIKLSGSFTSLWPDTNSSFLNITRLLLSPLPSPPKCHSHCLAHYLQLRWYRSYFMHSHQFCIPSPFLSGLHSTEKERLPRARRYGKPAKWWNNYTPTPPFTRGYSHAVSWGVLSVIWTRRSFRGLNSNLLILLPEREWGFNLLRLYWCQFCD